MTIFKLGNFRLHSGKESLWKIDLDELSDRDWETLAFLVAKDVGPFQDVEGVPTGGLKLAEMLKPYRTDTGVELLIVDDVCTNAASMEKQRNKRTAVGIVIFARGRYPYWVHPLFQYKGPDL